MDAIQAEFAQVRFQSCLGTGLSQQRFAFVNSVGKPVVASQRKPTVASRQQAPTLAVALVLVPLNFKLTKYYSNCGNLVSLSIFN